MRPPFVTAERLHGSVVDEPHRVPECLFEIEADPAAPEIVRLGNGLVMHHGPWIADGHGGIIPARCGGSNLTDHFRRGQAGIKFYANFSACREQLHVRAADVDYQDFHGHIIAF